MSHFKSWILIWTFVALLPSFSASAEVVFGPTAFHGLNNQWTTTNENLSVASAGCKVQRISFRF